MNTKKLLNGLMSSTIISLILFFVNFAIGWFCYDNMKSILLTTLPFLTVGIVSLISVGILDDYISSKRAAKPKVQHHQLIKIKNSIDYYNVLRRVS